VIAEAVLALALGALNEVPDAIGPGGQTWTYEFTDVVERSGKVVVIFNVWEDRPVSEPDFVWLDRECELDGFDGETLGGELGRFTDAVQLCLYQYESGDRPIARPGDKRKK